MAHRIVHTVHGEPLHRRIRRSAPSLARQVVPRLVDLVPFYGLLPREELDGEITDIAAETIRLIAEGLRTGLQQPPEKLARFGESAARRAQEGVPLEIILRAYQLGMLEVWFAFEPEIAERPDVGAVLAVVLDCLSTLTGVIAAAYVAEREAMAGTAQGERHRLVAALLAGEDAEPAALSAGLRVAERYEVLAVAFDDAAAGPGAGAADRAAVRGANPAAGAESGAAAGTVSPAPVGAATAAGFGDRAADGAIRTAISDRRRIRRVVAELARRTGGAALSMLDAAGGILLVPDAVAEPADLRVALSGAAYATVTVAAVPCAAAGVPAAARTAREVLRIVRAIGRPPEVYRLDDVLPQYQLSRPTEANRRLAALLDPLAEHADLLQTLRVHLANELNRKRTASDLHVHPNTVDYRLRRISTLTDLDLALPSAQRLLDAAMTARLLLVPTAGSTAGAATA